MTFFLRAGLALALAGGAGLARAQQPTLAGGDRQGFHFCSAPYPPLCARAPGKPTPAEAADCEEAVRNFAALVIAYRNCLGLETQRAILETNQTIEALKCREDSPDCPHRPAKIVIPKPEKKTKPAPSKAETKTPPSSSQPAAPSKPAAPSQPERAGVRP